MKKEKKENLSDKKIVKNDKKDIYLGNIHTVERNLDLPQTGRWGSTIEWESENPDIISSEGKVSRPEPGAGKKTVILKAFIRKGQAEKVKKFPVTVLEKKEEQEILGVQKVNKQISTGSNFELPFFVITELSDGSYGVNRVEWQKSDIFSPDEPGTYTLKGHLEDSELQAQAEINVTAEKEKVYSKSGPQKSAVSFSGTQIQLLDSPFLENTKRSAEYLLNVDEERMLYNFRKTAGLDTGNTRPPVGWESPESKLRGHTTGHFLSALALGCSVGIKEDRFKEKINYMVQKLGYCQQVMEDVDEFSSGFLSAYPEDQFDRLEDLTKYPEIWAPYYTLHKIMAGLFDCYALAENERALEIDLKLADWVNSRLCRLSRKKLQQMWSIYIAGEYGGMNEVMASLAEVAGRKEYLEIAKLFDNDKLFYPMYSGTDVLAGFHGNQHVPQAVGALEIYRAGGSKQYYQIAKNFWDIVTGHHIYNIGGAGEGEMFRSPDVIARYLTDKTAETCVSYNMLKLTKNLFSFEPKAEYMDYYERTLYNHILPSQDRSGPTGGSTYFMPLGPGMRKGFDVDSNTCCHGTGMENHLKYTEAIYYKSLTEEALYVNLYIPSRLDWHQKDFTLLQKGNFLQDNKVQLEVETGGQLDLKLRIPAWLKKEGYLKINGEKIDKKLKPGHYLSLDCNWQDGDTVELYLPFSFELERTPDQPKVGGIKYGPLVMAALNGSQEYIKIDTGSGNLTDRIEDTKKPLVFKLPKEGITLVPFHYIQEESYHTYFQIN